MIKRITWLALLALVLILPAPVLAAEPVSKTIEGKITNGTQGGSSTANQQVTLRSFQDGSEINSANATADASGNFVFNNIVVGSNATYQLSTTFQEADYYSEILTFADNETSKSVELTVYDSSQTDENISIVNAHTVIFIEQDGVLTIEEFLLIANMSGRTYIGSGDITITGKRKTLSFALPSNATNFQFSGDLNSAYILPDQNGFFDTLPLPPGSKQIVFSYSVDYKGSYTLNMPVNYPIKNYNLLVQGQDVKVDSNQLTKEEPLNLGEFLFSNFSATDIAASQTITARISGLGATSNSPSIFLWVGIVILALIAVAVAAYFVRRNRESEEIPVEAETGDDEQKLLNDIAQLDEDFENGKIDEETYHRLRPAKKAALAKLMGKAKEAD